MKKLVLLALTITMLCALLPTATADTLTGWYVAFETNGCDTQMYFSILQSVFWSCQVTGYLAGQNGAYNPPPYLTDPVVAYKSMVGQCGQSGIITRGSWYRTNGRSSLSEAFISAKVAGITDFGTLNLWQRCSLYAVCTNNPPPNSLFC